MVLRLKSFKKKYVQNKSLVSPRNNHFLNAFFSIFSNFARLFNFMGCRLFLFSDLLNLVVRKILKSSGKTFNKFCFLKTTLQRNVVLLLIVQLSVLEQSF